MRFAIFVMSLWIAGSALAQHSHNGTGHTMAGPKETDQSAFAALAEIVEILREDRDTDWSIVDIAALRQHLVDMDLLTTEAKVTGSQSPMGARFEVRGSGDVLEAIRNIVPAHAPFLAAETGWEVSTEALEDGVAINVDGDSAQIQALGFFGIMTIGAHHQEHHLMLAKGLAPHH